MKTLIIFDCYQTLIHLKNLAKIIQDFLRSELKMKISTQKIKHAYELIYYRYKFNHPRFKSPKDRQIFYLKYNQELIGILGCQINDAQAMKLNNLFGRSAYAIYPDVLSTLKYLKVKGLPLGIISNWTATLARIMSKLALTKYFDFIYSSANLKYEKPNPKIFTAALKHELKRYHKIYYIGNDYQLDICPARAAGLIPILVDRENFYSKKLACRKITKLTQLKKIIK